MSDLVNGLMLSDAARACLVAIARKLEAGRAELQRAYLAGEVTQAEFEQRVAALLAEVNTMVAPYSREINCAMQMAHREHKGIHHESRNSLN